MVGWHELWKRHIKWLLPVLAGAAIVIGFALWLAACQPNEPSRIVAVQPTENAVTFDSEVNHFYTAEDGVVVIPAGNNEAITDEIENDPGQSLQKPVEPSVDYYTLPNEAVMADGSIGILCIPRFGLSAPVYEAAVGSEMEAMTKGVAHFAVTSAWNGNIGLCSHNEAPTGAVAYFRDLYLLELGDVLTYETALGQRQYFVTENREIAANDWSYLKRSEDGLNRITLITCITGKPESRRMVQALEG